MGAATGWFGVDKRMRWSRSKIFDVLSRAFSFLKPYSERYTTQWTCPHGQKVLLRNRRWKGLSLTATLSDMYIVESGCAQCEGKSPNLTPGWEQPGWKTDTEPMPPRTAQPAAKPAPLVPAE